MSSRTVRKSQPSRSGIGWRTPTGREEKGVRQARRSLSMPTTLRAAEEQGLMALPPFRKECRKKAG